MIQESSKQPIVGIWSTVQRKDARGYYTQVSRLGSPLVNEVVNPQKDKDKFNASSPWDDAQFLKNVTNPELPKLIEAIYKIKAPAEPRNDLVDVFLKGVKGLNQPPRSARRRSCGSTPRSSPACTPSGSVCSTATTRASRTGVGSPTT